MYCVFNLIFLLTDAFLSLVPGTLPWPPFVNIADGSFSQPLTVCTAVHVGQILLNQLLSSGEYYGMLFFKLLRSLMRDVSFKKKLFHSLSFFVWKKKHLLCLFIFFH